MNEEWRPIRGFSKYEVSNTGFVRNVRSGRILKSAASGTEGKQQVSLLSDRHEKRYFLVHRLVAEYFLEDYNDQYVVVHKTEDFSDSSVNNIEMSVRWKGVVR